MERLGCEELTLDFLRKLKDSNSICLCAFWKHKDWPVPVLKLDLSKCESISFLGDSSNLMTIEELFKETKSLKSDERRSLVALNRVFARNHKDGRVLHDCIESVKD